MTSRVQKGGPVFRPLAKPRQRTSSSRLPESRESMTPGPSAAGSMPPPMLPVRDDYPILETPQYIPPARPAIPDLIAAAPTIFSLIDLPNVLATQDFIPQIPPAESQYSDQIATTESQYSDQMFNSQEYDAPIQPKRSARNKKATDSAVIDPTLQEEPESAPTKKIGRKVVPKPTRKAQTKRKKAADDAISDEEDQESDRPVKKRRTSKKSSTTTTKGRKSRKASEMPYDAEADPGEEIDPTVITMADLCSDSGTGRVSTKAAQIQSNHSAWKASNKERRDRLKARLELKKRGEKEEDEQPEPGAVVETEEATVQILETGSPSPSANEDEDDPTAQDESGQGFDYSQNVTRNRFTVQIRMGANGETIIDEDSLFVDRNETDETANYKHVTESDTSKFTNSASYGKKYHSTRWSGLETEKFYDLLSQFGENYEMISLMLEGRDRKACQNKFKAEDKRDKARIDHCLRNQKAMDITALSEKLGKDFSGPTPVIRVPTPPIIPDEPVASTSYEVPSSSGFAKKRKRSRSRTQPLGDDVQVVGTVDEFDPGFDKED